MSDCANCPHLREDHLRYGQPIAWRQCSASIWAPDGAHRCTCEQFKDARAEREEGTT